MDFSFDNLKKISGEPAARMLAACNVKLETPLTLPANAQVPQTLQFLAEQQAHFDMLHMLAVALPKREAVWWACLAARDVLGDVPDAKLPTPLVAAERWVFKPTPENRARARMAMEHAEIDDDTVYCAMAAFYAEGNMGDGDMAEIPAPPSAVSGAVVCMNMISVAAHAEQMNEHVARIVNRALDIARGGNGQIAEKEDA
ncbi:DUF6931 family protein [Qingshengfaniella alkalisoli]|uniref:Uncharacterized protein n=1 Tax=Qingshengfaniella alkalisoli TaxID=2599296 RepID=A0A5B8J161_9RHOB|nr:hypothetical protein [Qingshengfaniella alkalisoli]QDY70921.1 hypothetical protein FPZ52_14570 [Qingshengfaniella alkalisoli]